MLIIINIKLRLKRSTEVIGIACQYKTKKWFQDHILITHFISWIYHKSKYKKNNYKINDIWRIIQNIFSKKQIRNTTSNPSIYRLKIIFKLIKSRGSPMG